MKYALLCSLLLSQSAWCEYRVYQYVIKNKVISSFDQPQSEVITSSLNPQSFVAYNGGSGLVAIDLVRTWICPGYTGKKKKLCDSPYGKIPKELL